MNYLRQGHPSSWSVIRKRMVLILTMTLSFGILSAVVSFFVLSPQYAANTTILVNQTPSSNLSVQYDNILANQALVKTYSDIIKSNTIENDVIKELNLGFTQKQMNKMVTVTSPDQSQIIEISVVAPSETLAVSIANALAQTFQAKSQSIMKQQTVEIVDPASVEPNAAPIKPSKILNIGASFLIGLIMSIGFALLLDYFDYRLRTEDDVERYLNYPVLGVVHEYSGK